MKGFVVKKRHISCMSRCYSDIYLLVEVRPVTKAEGSGPLPIAYLEETGKRVRHISCTQTSLEKNNNIAMHFVSFVPPNVNLIRAQ